MQDVEWKSAAPILGKKCVACQSRAGGVARPTGVPRSFIRCLPGLKDCAPIAPWLAAPWGHATVQTTGLILGDCHAGLAKSSHCHQGHLGLRTGPGRHCGTRAVRPVAVNANATATATDIRDNWLPSTNALGKLVSAVREARVREAAVVMSAVANDKTAYADDVGGFRWRRPPPVQPLPTDGLQRLRLCWGLGREADQGGQSPLAGPGRSLGLPCAQAGTRRLSAATAWRPRVRSRSAPRCSRRA
jgi:hypothetical protein